MENLKSELIDIPPMPMTKTDKKKRKRLAPKKVAMIKALESNLGNITEACSRVGISRQTYYEWYHLDPDFKLEVETIPERIKDFVETALMKQIGSGIPSSTIFFLKTKAKDRGYIEETNLNHTVMGNSSIQIVTTSMEEIKNDKAKVKSQTDRDTSSP
jgi:hypothetical protein